MMLASIPTHVSWLDQVSLLQGTSARLLMVCGMGAIIGLEREWRHKASGLRTNILICMGSALFTILSIVLAGDTNPSKGQVASNIVQGIGFLGAGMILHARNRVLGLTSAATVWVVAAIGMACGAGLYAGAAIATLVVWVSLKLIGVLESKAKWKRYPMLYEVRGKDEQSMFAAILAVLDSEHLRLNVIDRDQLGDQQRVTFSILASSARHKELLAKLTASDATDHVTAFWDEEED